ncbi:MAG TPA: DUF4142 domain-containing protein [Bryobacteraceae bacterium]|nr:DUF4142 domain-containing protein [Bryobacteraceae bacterium]
MIAIDIPKAPRIPETKRLLTYLTGKALEAGGVMPHSLLFTLILTACSAVYGQTGTQTKSGSTKSSDLTFLRQAIEGNLAEIQTGQLAEKNASSQAVKQFAERMVTDHTNMLQQAKSVASEKGITPPTSPSAKDQATYQILAAKTGTAFDKDYMSQMLKNHNQDIAEFEKEANSGSDADIRALASKALPTLQEHLRLAQSTARQIGVSTTGGLR